MPLGTYNKVKQVYVEEADNELIIKETENRKIIAQHKIESGKGQLVQDTNHLRDRTKGIDTYIETVASYFSDYDKAMNYLQAIRTRLPRYTRDQLQMIVNAMKNEEQKQIDLALEECIKRGFYSATEFIDIVQYLNRQRQSNSYSNVAENDEIKPIHPWSESALQTNIQKRDIQEYLAVMEGDVR